MRLTLALVLLAVIGSFDSAAAQTLRGVAGDLQHPDVLDALAARATRMTLGEGQSHDVTLRLVRR
jgi:hypothetical protein